MSRERSPHWQPSPLRKPGPLAAARRALTVAVTPLLWSAGCVDALGLTDYQDAVAKLCKCDVEVPQLDGRCSEVLGERLDSVSEPLRGDWLDYFAEHCADSCENAFACYQQPGTCSTVSCQEDRECCGFTEGGSVFCELSGDEGSCRG